MNGNPPDRFTVTPEPATVGQPVTVCFTDANRPNEHIEILLFNGIEPHTTGHQGLSYAVYTDSNGVGCFYEAELPEWLAHVVRCEGSADHAIPTGPA